MNESPEGVHQPTPNEIKKNEEIEVKYQKRILEQREQLAESGHEIDLNREMVQYSGISKAEIIKGKIDGEEIEFIKSGEGEQGGWYPDVSYSAKINGKYVRSKEDAKSLFYRYRELVEASMAVKKADMDEKNKTRPTAEELVSKLLS